MRKNITKYEIIRNNRAKNLTEKKGNNIRLCKRGKKGEIGQNLYYNESQNRVYLQK